MKFMWFLTAAGSVIGGVIMILGVAGANGSPQQAAAAAIGIGCAVIPYCLTRSMSEHEQIVRREKIGADGKE
jgi:hypothetical protein